MTPADKWLLRRLADNGARLREVRAGLLRQEPGGAYRWFQGPDGCDLFLWYREPGGLVQIQLTFARRALEWSERDGVRTSRLVSFDPLQPEVDQSRLQPDRAPDPETLQLAQTLL